ncbi:MAG TPA: hypothetical protein VG964_03925 [Candidatus Saccharimonadales bacterium]|nr:hypothetical protein [Candidatus Saccharimonadales bacterium]
MTSSNSRSDSLIRRLERDYPAIKFKPGQQDHWSPSSKTVFYNSSKPFEELSCSLLHELSHALLAHQDYRSDFELLRLESEAWAKAAELGPKYGVDIEDEHIQNCLDTYRDWLHRRSTCPSCGMHVVQKDGSSYKCFNCSTEWSVTAQRFVRAYRKTFKKFI